MVTPGHAHDICWRTKKVRVSEVNCRNKIDCDVLVLTINQPSTVQTELPRWDISSLKQKTQPIAFMTEFLWMDFETDKVIMISKI